jgi:hypothetical protein
LLASAQHGPHQLGLLGSVGAAGALSCRLPLAAFRGNMPVMSESVQKLGKRIEELQGAARRARLEAMQLGAKLLTTSTSELAGSPTNAHRQGELAALRARYEGLVKIADEAQAQIDRLQADEHERKYYR